MAKSTWYSSEKINFFWLEHIVYIYQFAWELRAQQQMHDYFPGDRVSFFEIFHPEKIDSFCTTKV